MRRACSSRSALSTSCPCSCNIATAAAAKSGSSSTSSTLAKDNSPQRGTVLILTWGRRRGGDCRHTQTGQIDGTPGGEDNRPNERPPQPPASWLDSALSVDRRIGRDTHRCGRARRLVRRYRVDQEPVATLRVDEGECGARAYFAPHGVDS